eukprot:3412904-Pyramimonas_sp.AAC.1
MVDRRAATCDVLNYSITAAADNFLGRGRFVPVCGAPYTDEGASTVERLRSNMGNFWRQVII